MRSDRVQAGPGLARDVLRRVVGERRTRAADEVGRLVFLGEGLSYRTYGATCLLGGAERPLVVRLPCAQEGPQQRDRAVQERRLLEHLASLDLPLRLPRPVAEVPVPSGTAVVQEWVGGVPCDLRASRSTTPWVTVGEAAACIHGVDPAPLRGAVRGPATVREDALERLEPLRGLELPEARAALAWAMAHLPEPEPSRLLHGDLLGQNLLLSPGEPLGVIDWSEARLGDPAYDLAVVTRGKRQPFQVPDGMERLLDVYRRASGRDLGAASVRLHELALSAGFYRADVETYGEGSPAAANAQATLRNLLARTAGA